MDLSRRGIEAFPLDVPPSTAWLILSNNMITRVPSEVRALERIERLALNDNSIAEVEEGLGELSRLSWIDMTRNNLKTLPRSLFFRRLVGLGLSENEFEEVPECVFNFKALRKFGFFANKVRFVSPRIQNLQNLVKLDLSNNLIEELPDEICLLKSLTWLNISSNKLKRLPPQFGDLENLEELGLGNNALQSIPRLHKMKALRVFSAFNNEIEDFEICSESLWKADLSNNKLRRFPKSLLKSPALHTLSLRNNQIEEICLERVLCSNLRSIDLRSNRLKSIPLKFLRSVESCQALLLEGNNFTPAKDVFPQIPTLQSVCLSLCPRMFPEKTEAWNVCDTCGRLFANEPIRMYFLASLEPEEKFCLEEEVCTSRCYLNSIKAKTGEDLFCSRI